MTILGNFTMPIGNYVLPACLLERDGRKWVAFPPAPCGLVAEIEAADLGPEFAIEAIRFGEKALGVHGR